MEETSRDAPLKLESKYSEAQLDKDDLVLGLEAESNLRPSSTYQDDALDFYSILRKHDNINEMDLLKNVEAKTRSMLPLMDDERVLSTSSKERRRTAAKIENNSPSRPKNESPSNRLKIEGSSKKPKVVEKRAPIRAKIESPKRIVQKRDFGCNTVALGVDKAVMTDDASQADELAKLIKVEAQKTIQMLEMFMSANNNTAIVRSGEVSYREAEQKANEDLLHDLSQEQPDTQEILPTQEEDSGSEVNYTQEDDLFTGMDETNYAFSGYYAKHASKSVERKMPFSKYVQLVMNRGEINDSANTQADMFDEELMKTSLNLNSKKLKRNDDMHLKESLKYLRK